MPRLNLGDMQAVSRLGAALYSAPDLEGLCATILNDLPTLVAADRVSYNFINIAMNRLSAVTKPSELFPGALAAMNAHFRQHPVARRVKETAELRWLRISDVATQRAWRGTDLYNAYYRQIGTDHQISTMVRGPQNGFFAVALSRGKRDFSDRDALVLNLTLPHLIQGYIAAGRVTQLARELGSLRQGLDAADVGLVLLSDDGRIRLATSRARAWLNEYFDMAARASNRLPPPVEGWVLRHVSQGRSEDHLPAIRHPLIAYRRGKSLSIRLSGGPGDLALVLSEAYSTVPLPGLASLGLSRRETEVLRWVAQGKRNADIAGILGISTATVNHHVEHIHRKLDVETRTAAVACALTVVQGSRPA